VVDRPFYIVGVGGAGREALDIALAMGVKVTAFLDDGRAGEIVRGLDVLLPEQAPPGAEYVIGIASPSVRLRLSRLLDGRGLRARTLVHPRATVGPEASLGRGCIVHANVLVSSDVTLADHCQVHYNATVGHDTSFAEFVTVYPGANVAGAVRLAEGATVGSGAVVLQGLSIGARAMIGAGAVVTRDVLDEAVVGGVPARVLHRTRDTRDSPNATASIKDSGPAREGDLVGETA
jgi:sugar O-acyltransferase (sialic acid O-acetyltransferase NeuD family)